MKGTSWDSYLKKQLKNPKVREAFDEENRILNLGIALATRRARSGLTQEAVAKRIGTSAPQVSRTENTPANANVRTLMRYADALGMELQVKLVPGKRRSAAVKRPSGFLARKKSVPRKVGAMR
jgi:transcriptional regulator with XRE-family HTH domain